MTVDNDNARVRIPPPLLYLATLGAALGVDAQSLFPLRLHGIGLASGIGVPFGSVIAVAGIALMTIAAGLFKRAGTSLPPWQPTTSLVLQGPYRWTRNPMYLGMSLTYVGLAIAFDSLVALVLLAAIVLPIMQTHVIAREESYLERKFGEEYLAYKRRVRRWL